MRRWIPLFAAVPVVLGLAFFGQRWWHNRKPLAAGNDSDPSLSHAAARGDDEPEELPPAIAGLDLSRIGIDDTGTTAPAADKKTARLTLDPELERTAIALLAAHRLPEAAVVMIDTASGQVLVYASHVDHGAPRDLCSEATAPSASVFKIVTAAALVEDAHLGPDTKQCYSGGEQRLSTVDLFDDPQRDKWCATLSGAMGRSLNTVFARLAKNHLTPPKLEAMARRFGYGQPVPFDVPVQPSTIRVPTDGLEFARTAAGFWNTTLSPLEAAWLSATIARGGDSYRPSIVKQLVGEEGDVVYEQPDAPLVRHAVATSTAEQLTTMMEHTVSEGTSFRAFHDAKSTPFLPGITVAGKTGTLTDAQNNRYYTWFTGFAPSHPSTVKTVAISVLVVNGPAWQVKANVIARDMLRAYFAQLKVSQVTKPSINAIARHKR
jgi:cell division protein FtsI/penicillin-binding protein 2